ncbi:hypothetical protein M8J76_012858 [Diaphorina citri]|nr:hypothetical protein M8J75_002080 [Diaphorina citri]KAI5719637.1 hypothetical protein M8J76_012858 [Diaphorina citri]KAI5720636.1 hypothetical protein M8J77_009800 [Diaphorina citri]
MNSLVSLKLTPCLGICVKSALWLQASLLLFQVLPLHARSSHSTCVSPHVSCRLGSTRHDIRRDPNKPGVLRIKLPPNPNVTDYLDQTQGWERYSIIFGENWTHGQIESNGFTRRKMRKPHKYNKAFARQMVTYMQEHMDFEMPPSTSSEEMRQYEADFIARGNKTTEPPSVEMAWNRTLHPDDEYYAYDDRTTKFPITSLHWLQNDDYKWTTSAEFAEIWHKVKLARIGNISFDPFPAKTTRSRVHQKRIADEMTVVDHFDIHAIPTIPEEYLFFTTTPKHIPSIELKMGSPDYFNDSIDVNLLPKPNLTQYKGQFDSAEHVLNVLIDKFNISSEPLYSSEYFLQTMYKNQPTFSTPEFLRRRHEERKKKKAAAKAASMGIPTPSPGMEVEYPDI